MKKRIIQGYLTPYTEKLLFTFSHRRSAELTLYFKFGKKLPFCHKWTLTAM